MRYVSCGGLPVAVISPSSGSHKLLESTGPAIGQSPNPLLVAAEVEFGPDDVLVAADQRTLGPIATQPQAASRLMLGIGELFGRNATVALDDVASVLRDSGVTDQPSALLAVQPHQLTLAAGAVSLEVTRASLADAMAEIERIAAQAGLNADDSQGAVSAVTEALIWALGQPAGPTPVHLHLLANLGELFADVLMLATDKAPSPIPDTSMKIMQSFMDTVTVESIPTLGVAVHMSRCKSHHVDQN